MPKRSMESFGATKPSVGRERAPNVNELVEMLDWPKKGGSVQVRVIGSVAPRGVHKIKVTKRTGEETEITKACLAYDPAIDDRDSDKHCPYCEMDKSVQRFSKVYFANVIDRRLQEDQPARVKITLAEKKSGFKDMDSSSWTPVRVMRAPSTLALRLKQLGERNVVKSKTGEKKVFPVNHPKFGFDLDVSFDKSLPAASMYSADRNTDDKYTPLTEEESEYLVFDLDLLYPPEEEDAAESEATSLSSRWKKAHSDEDDEDEPKAKKKTKKKVDDDDLELDEDEDEEPKKSKKKKVVDDDDELDLDDEDEPTTKSKKPTKKKVVDDDDDLELDEDEDEEPKKSKKPTKKKVVDEDDDEDELDLDDEDEPPKKSSKKKFVPSVGSQVKITDEDDEEFSGEVASIKGDVITIVDDEDERTRFKMTDVTIEAVTSKKKSKKIDDEDDEDEPPAKSKKKPTKKKVDEDDDEDEDLDLDEDEDEEDEPPKKSKKPAKKKPVEDFDDEDIPF